MNLNNIVVLFKSLVKAAFASRNDPTKWSGWIDIHGDEDHQKIELAGKIKHVSFEVTGITFKAEINGAEHVLDLQPDLNEYRVSLDGVLDPEARVKVALKSTMSSPLRTGFDVRPVTFEADECRINLRYTP